MPMQSFASGQARDQDPPLLFQGEKARKNLIIQMDDSCLQKKNWERGCARSTRLILPSLGPPFGLLQWSPEGKSGDGVQPQLDSTAEEIDFGQRLLKKTIAGVEEHRCQRAFTERDLPHQLVNHEQHEVIKENVFTTNMIDSRGGS